MGWTWAEVGGQGAADGWWGSGPGGLGHEAAML